MTEKKWKNEKEFFSYKEAKKHKKQLQFSPEGATMQYKIKRYNHLYILKSRIDPELLDAVKEIEEKLSKK